mgnify:CR=1 FL=1|jgi:hypothetical protein|tara:strand:- start:10550 stop:11368 length:819 start_codon:yes stop_codon:yes gene_type:complete
MSLQLPDILKEDGQIEKIGDGTGTKNIQGALDVFRDITAKDKGNDNYRGGKINIEGGVDQITPANKYLDWQLETYGNELQFYARGIGGNLHSSRNLLFRSDDGTTPGTTDVLNLEIFKGGLTLNEGDLTLTDGDLTVGGDLFVNAYEFTVGTHYASTADVSGYTLWIDVDGGAGLGNIHHCHKVNTSEHIYYRLGHGAESGNTNIWMQVHGSSRKVQVYNDFTVNGSVEIDGNINHDGTYVGFYGASPIAQASAPVTLGDVITVLQNLGLTA